MIYISGILTKSVCFHARVQESKCHDLDLLIAHKMLYHWHLHGRWCKTKPYSQPSILKLEHSDWSVSGWKSGSLFSHSFRSISDSFRSNSARIRAFIFSLRSISDQLNSLVWTVLNILLSRLHVRWDAYYIKPSNTYTYTYGSHTIVTIQRYNIFQSHNYRTSIVVVAIVAVTGVVKVAK